MDPSTVFGMNLPLYITLLIFASYILWLRFYSKHGTLAIKNVDDLLSILKIFMFLTTFIFAFFLTMYIIIPAVNELKISNFDPAQANIILSTLAILVIISIVLFVKRTYFYKTAISEIFFITWVMILFSYIYILFFFYENYFRSYILTFFILTILITIFTIFLLIIYYITCKNILSANEKKFILFKEHEKKWLTVTSLIIVIVLEFLVLPMLLIPSTKTIQPQIISYVVESNSGSNNYSNAYEKIRFTTEIKSFGIMGFDTQKQFIYLNYAPFDINSTTTTISLINNKNETYLYDSQSQQFKEQYTAHGQNVISIENVTFYPDQHVLAFSFHEQELKDIKQIVLEGYIEKNITNQLYSYKDNSRDYDTCNSTHCGIIFNITNSLDLPVEQEGDLLINFENTKLLNKSSCKFVNVTSNFGHDTARSMWHVSCQKNVCYFGIFDNTTLETIFDITLYIDTDYKTVSLNHMKIEEPIQVIAKFDINC